MRRRESYFSWEWRSPARTDDGLLGLAVRFGVNVAALWVAQWLVTGFDIDGWGPLLFGALIFGVVNAFIRPSSRS